MPGIKGCFGRKGEDLRPDAVDQVSLTAAGHVSSANTVIKDRITAKGSHQCSAVECDTTGGVPGSMHHQPL